MTVFNLGSGHMLKPGGTKYNPLDNAEGDIQKEIGRLIWFIEKKI